MADNPLAVHLARRIDAEGPLSVAQYMAEALGHPRYGYYAAGGDPLGTGGDFVTAPEISQMFGELIGLWLIARWRETGRPDPVALVELGPGRGTLMTDLLRAARIDPDFHAALSVHLVEISPRLRDHQAAALRAEIAAGLPVAWHDSPAALPDPLPGPLPGPLFLVANEYVDALPVRQFQRIGRAWHERLVDLATPGSAFAGPAFRFVLGPPNPATALLIPPALRDGSTVPDGGIVEARPGVPPLAADIGARLAATGGTGLIIDYGGVASRPGSTLQAVRRHARAGPLDDPGRADLTAHVDFAVLRQSLAEAGGRPHGPVSQGTLLARLGIGARAVGLKRRADANQAAAIDRALHRLLHPDEMGMLFKALSVTGHDDPVPFGFHNPTAAVPFG